MKFSPISQSTRFRPAVTIISVLIWLVLISLLVKDRYFGGEPGTTENLNIAAVESDDWFLIRIGGAYSGFGRSRQFKNDEHWTIRDELNYFFESPGPSQTGTRASTTQLWMKIFVLSIFT